MKTVLAGLFAFAVGVLLGGDPAAAYPTRPITLIVPFPPGGATDVQTRVLAPFVEKHLGTSVVITYRPGANGMVGTTALAESKPDGYTIGVLNFPSLFAPIHEGKAKYTQESFFPLINQAVGNIALVVHGESAIKTVPQFIAAAKASPGALTVGVTGVGSPSHLVALLFQKMNGFQVSFVPFNGAAPTRTALLGKHITLGMLNEFDFISSHQTGEVRLLAVASPARSPFSPDVPTFREAGFDLELQALNGFAAPQGVPDEVRKKLLFAFETAAKDPEYVSAAEKRNILVSHMSHEEFKAALARGNVLLSELWKTHRWSN